MIVLGGAAPTARPNRPAPRGDGPVGGERPVVIAADRGVDHALALGLVVDIAIGDFDSVSDDGLRRVRDRGGEVRTFPADKDATDLELALEAAVDLGARDVLVLGGPPAERIDHFVANIACLSSPRWSGLDVRARLDEADVVVVPGPGRRSLRVEPGQVVTVLAYGGPACDVVSTGLRWPLDGSELRSGSSRGVSNEATSDTVEIELASGTVVVLVVDPDGAR